MAGEDVLGDDGAVEPITLEVEPGDVGAIRILVVVIDGCWGSRSTHRADRESDAEKVFHTPSRKLMVGWLVAEVGPGRGTDKGSTGSNDECVMVPWCDVVV